MKINYKNVTPNEDYDNTRMDMILGNDILPHFIRGSQRICLPSGKYIELGPFASMTFPNAKHCPVMDQNMIPTGASTLEDSHPPSINVLMSQKYGTDSDDELTNLILQLWQTENCGIESATMLESEYLTQEYLLQLFEKEIIIGEDGLLYVALPWNGKQDRMGNNKSLAYRRLTCLIEKLRRNPELLKAYNRIIEEQLEAGIIERVTPEMKNQGPEYFTPQNAVFKENSTNTKVRIVGDSSSKQRDTLSLNDCLYEGPNMLKTAPGILLRHREKKYPAVGDIARAFHQIRLQEKDRNATKWLWIKDINKPPSGDNLVEFRFTRIPFGMKCSPFLLAATIRHYLLLAATILSKEIEQNLYVDNLMISTNNPDEVLPKVLAVQKQFREMGMHVREIATNHQPTMQEIPEADRAESNRVKFLGYIWNIETDTITILIPEPPEKTMTKRDVASFLAKLYDPMGYTAPLQVQIKRFVQLIWNDGLDWKQTLSDKLNIEWRKVKELYKHRTIEIPRQLRSHYFPNQKPEMAVFCDASKHTYGNAVYLLYRSGNGSAESTLIGAKSKVRPSNGSEWTIPRLETLAVEIGMKHAQSLIKELSDDEKPSKLDVFSDSTIALSWILTKEQIKQWVHNRVNSVHMIEAELKEMNIEVSFHHVASDQNPADLATRGMNTTDLQNSTLWFTGPALLKEDRNTWETQLEGKLQYSSDAEEMFEKELKPKSKNTSIRRTKKEKMNKVAQNIIMTETEVFTVSIQEQISTNVTTNYQSFVPYAYTNSLSSLTNITNAILKFITKSLNTKTPNNPLLREYRDCDKIVNRTEREVQRRRIARLTIFQEHYKEAKSRNWRFKDNLKPFQSQDGLWRTQRHFSSPNIPMETSQPILVHSEHKLAILLAQEIHLQNAHLPAQYLQMAIRTKYWIRSDGRLARTVISKCVACKKVKGLPFQYPYTTTLNKNRTMPSTPFSKVGLDYFGPLKYKISQFDTQEKAYVLIYTCLTTRCTHLELCADSSTRSYIGALKAIFGQRRVPNYLYSDNAQAFILGENILEKDMQDFSADPEMICFLARHEISFKHITPLSPWMGGIYERVVGIAKSQFRKVLGKLTYTFPELHYTLKRVEGVINSRPLIRNPSEKNDVPVLRPIDFILPSVLLDVPNDTDNNNGDPSYDPTMTTTESDTRQHLLKLDETLNKLWKIWSSSYLLLLRDSATKKNRYSTTPPKIGQIVLVHEELIPRHRWPLSRIVAVKGEKPNIRSVTILINGSTKERAVNQLIPLEIEDEADIPTEQLGSPIQKTHSNHAFKEGKRREEKILYQFRFRLKF